MGVINAHDIKPGMILEKDLVLANGRRLLPRGAVIEDKHLRIFKAWGVTEAAVANVSREEAEAGALSALEPLALQYAASLCELYFAPLATEHPAFNEIKRLTVACIARRIMLGEDPPRPAVVCTDNGPAELAPGQTDARHVADGHVELASFPEICELIREVVNDPRASSTRLAEIISRDTSLCASLLRLVNSPLYGFPNKVESIPRAVTLIGTRELCTLTYGLVAVRFFRGIPASYLDMRRFWKHAAACGVFARILCSFHGRMDEERAFVAGLLHDIGRLVLISKYPAASARALAKAQEQNLPLHETELEIFGFHHARVGSHMLKAWHFPDSLRDMVSFHHEPTKAHQVPEAAVLHLADVLSVAMDLATGGAPRPVPALEPGAWEAVGLPLSALEAAFGQFDRQFQEVMGILMDNE
ncbi:HDOD domain-containing protein [Megalodesulfovibrio gigas]|uniref:Putative metal dependent phosphohydrolase n=1 Tax=Megalodesulfovibrio gigas (strain ATCC 19364 / DSM 1382 / NCIMB 9332 / VKM B-1759) TaxID=1121448 RepID=T2GEI7_MEGG1|nr:HDOD domain-containing protein [Megalodesulfovibrio gigas]AGW14693.1 putative metal dependent phosphohydrolase [Megalodesulfovibrio gigas DSM 1382 = ATCC 19364]